MTLQELRYLVALADHGHFGRAAEACHITQPTLSAQLKKLEDYLGVVLFERTSKALKLTPAGAPLLAKAREIVAAADALIAMAHGQGKPMSGPLHLGVIPTLGPYLLPWLLPLLKKSFPEARLILHEDLTDALIERLKSHRVDAALLALPIPEDDLNTQPLFDEPFFLACPKNHKLAKAKTIDPAALSAEPMLLLTDGHCLREQTLAVCGQAAAANEAADFRATSLETIRQMVAAGMGCTLLPALAVGKASETIAIRSIEGDAFRRIGLVWRKSYPKQTEMTLLNDAILNHLPPAVRSVA